MRIDRGKREQYIVFGTIVLLTFFLVISFITFLINININKGVIPLIFIFLSIYFVMMFVYDLFLKYGTYENRKTAATVKVRYLVAAFLSVILYILSYITLWK